MVSSIDATLHPRDRYLVLFLRLIGGMTLLAFLAAVMPRQWMIEMGEMLGFKPFPDSPLTYYLARNLSLLYGFIGALLIILSMDIDRYRRLIWYSAVGTIAFGGLQLIVDSMSNLPSWWTVGESFSTFCGGLIFYWLQKGTPVNRQAST